jgi:RNA polymerase sigma-70 factor (ECF subfamily)
MSELRSAIEQVFRRESGRIIAGLIRVSQSFDRAEEAMQDAFASALSDWEKKGIPENPGGLDQRGCAAQAGRLRATRSYAA